MVDDGLPLLRLEEVGSMTEEGSGAPNRRWGAWLWKGKIDVNSA